MGRRAREKVPGGRVGSDDGPGLHGMKQSEGRDQLSAFLHRAQARGKSLVLVITGKGTAAPEGAERGVLRRAVPLWLGRLACAGAGLGLDALLLPVFVWCVAVLPLTAMRNVGVSFDLAFQLALRAHNVSGVDRVRIRSAIWARWRSKPLSFFWPVKSALQQETAGG